jgi:hypothetical protein
VEQMHELAIGKAMGSSCGIDPHNPQRSHISAALPAVSIGIRERLEHRLIGRAKMTASRATLAGSQIQYFFMSTAGVRSPLYTRHELSPS